MTAGDGLGGFLRRDRRGIHVCVLVAVFTVLVVALLYAAQVAPIDPLNRHLAWLSRAVLGLFGLPTRSSGAVVTLGRFAVEIKNNCNAAYEIGLYAAAVWAYPAPVRDRVVGTLLGAGVLY